MTARHTTELVPANGALPSVEDVERRLLELVEAGDTDMLNEVARQAAAHQHYETRNAAAVRADYFGRIKVLAEASIGKIDLTTCPKVWGTELVIDGHVVPLGARRSWRLLASADRDGLLGTVIDEIAADPERSVTTWVTIKWLESKGLRWVDTTPLLRRYQALYRHDGLSINAVSRATGLTGTGLNDVLCQPGKKPRRRRMARENALRVAAALGVPPTELRPSTYVKAGVRRRLPRERKLVGGRLDETYTLIRRALRELDAAAGTSGRWGTAEAYDHLYKAEEIIGGALKKAI